MATLKQERAFKGTLENQGRVSKAMKAAGYAPAMVKNPQILTRSKGWQELLDEYLPEEKLTKVTKEGLEATRTTWNVKGRKIKEPDFAVRHKYLETGLKVRGKLKDTDNGGDTFNFNFLTLEQQQRVARRVQTSVTESEGTLNRLPHSNEPKV